MVLNPRQKSTWSLSKHSAWEIKIQLHVILIAIVLKLTFNLPPTMSKRHWTVVLNAILPMALREQKRLICMHVKLTSLQMLTTFCELSQMSAKTGGIACRKALGNTTCMITHGHVIIPVSQCMPVYPGAQRHWYPPTLLTHVAPFLHRSLVDWVLDSVFLFQLSTTWRELNT